MTQSDREPSSLDDANLEKLLRAFFASEMPTAVRELPAETQSLSVLPVAGRKSRRPAIIALAVAAGALAACALVALLPQPQPIATNELPTRPGEALADLGAVSGEVSQDAFTVTEPATRSYAAYIDSSDAPLTLNFDMNGNYSLTQESMPVESLTYATSNGRVEQNTFLNTTNGVYFDPGSGQRVMFAYPVIDIEVLNVAVPTAAPPAAPEAATPPAQE